MTIQLHIPPFTNAATSSRWPPSTFSTSASDSTYLPNAPVLKPGKGFASLKGAVWFADQKCLLFSDLPNDRNMRWTEDGGVSVFRRPSGFANGHTRDERVRLIGCSH